MAADYRKKAQEMVDPGVQAQINAARNGLNSSLTQLDSSKGGINQQYDQAVSDRKQQGHFEKNDLSNTMLGRGMSRSSLVTTGLAGVNARTGRSVDRIEGSRTSDLNNIEMQKALLNQNFANTENSIRATGEGQVLSLADQLEARDRQLSMQERQAAQSAEIARRELALKEQAYNEQKAANTLKNMGSMNLPGAAAGVFSALSGNKSYKEDATAGKNSFSSKYMEVRDASPSDARAMLEENRSDIISRYGMDFYKSMMKDQEEYEANLQAEEEAKAQEKENSKSIFSKFWDFIF